MLIEYISISIINFESIYIQSTKTNESCEQSKIETENHDWFS